MADFLKRLESQFKGRKTIAVDMPTIKILQAMREKYSTVYPLFLNTVEMVDIPERADIYKELRAGMKKLMELSGILLGDKGRMATEEEIQEFLDTTKGVELGVSNLYVIFKQSNELQSKLSAVETQTGMSMETLKNFTSMFSKGIRQRSTREGGLMAPVGDLGYIGSGIFEGQGSLTGKAGIVGGALGLALGPFSPFANFAASAGYNMYQRAKERKMARQMMGGEVGLMAKQFGISPSDVERFRNPRGIGSPVPKQFTNPMGHTVDDLFKQYTGSAPQGAISSTRSVQQETPTVGKYTTNSAVAAGLKSFFSEAAFQAPYTKKLMEILEGKHSSGFAGLGGLFSGITGLFTKMLGGFGSVIARASAALMGALGGLKGIGSLLGKGAAVAGAGVAGWTAGRWLGENVHFGGKSLDQHVQDFAEHKIPGFKVGKEVPTYDREAIQKRAMQLQKGSWFHKPMSVMDSLRKAQDEIAGTHRTEVLSAYNKQGNEGKSIVDSVREVAQQSQVLDYKKSNNEELIGALKEFAESKKRDGNITIPITANKDNDPFLDYLNMGLLGEDF